MFESKPEGRRRKGRPRMKWLEDVEGNLRERKLETWRQKTVRMGLLLTEHGWSVSGRRESVEIALPLLCRPFFDITKV